jgi:hypothetical protein
MSEKDYAYNRFGAKGQRVGQAVVDLLSKSQPVQTVGETIDAFGSDYAKQVQDCIEDNQHKYKSPFYIFVLTKKEFWADNVLRNFFIARQTPPHAFQMMEQYSNFTKTLYLVDANAGKIKIIWSLPGFQDCITVAKNPHLYSPELVKWIEDCFSRKLDKDEYRFEE